MDQIKIAGRFTDLGKKILAAKNGKGKHLTTLNWGPGFHDKHSTDNFQDDAEPISQSHYLQSLRSPLKPKQGSTLLSYNVIKPQ